MADLKGLNYIAYLLGHPNREINVMELVRTIDKNHPDVSIYPIGDESLNGKVDWNDADEVLDEKANSEYKKRLKVLSEERKLATESENEIELERIDIEFEIIKRELNAATGLGGRSRKFSTPKEKARITVQKAIKNALDKIKENDPNLYQYLKNPIIRTGYTCSYNPDPDNLIKWKL